MKIALLTFVIFNTNFPWSLLSVFSTNITTHTHAGLDEALYIYNNIDLNELKKWLRKATNGEHCLSCVSFTFHKVSFFFISALTYSVGSRWFKRISFRSFVSALKWNLQDIRSWGLLLALFYCLHLVLPMPLKTNSPMVSPFIPRYIIILWIHLGKI